MSEAIVITLIQSAATVLGFLVPSVAIYLASRRLLNNRKLMKDYLSALADIEFMLGVEEEHCRMHKEATGNSNKQIVRTIASANFNWSYRHTPSRIKRKKDSLALAKQTTTQKLALFGFRDMT
jgi:hypothetical protein